MYFVMKILTWIVYAIIAHNFAPKYAKRDIADKKAKAPKVKLKRYRLAGLGIGVVTGLVFFAFFMMPVMGLMDAYNAVAKHKTEFGGYSKSTRTAIINEDGDAKDIIKIQNTIVKSNDQIQASAFGKITKFTGMQLLAKGGTTHLMRVNKKRQFA